ncbi:MAG: class I SAM-dependent methyltransferase [Betaproteobacteria bacterium]|nr:class I SAM-dependent methyltransferase [Betaproteobacteria bacterium]
MEQQLNQIRDQQRQTWDKFSPGWKKWDELVLGWIAPVGDELIRNARLHDACHLLDVAGGTGEPGLSAARIVTRGKVTVIDLSDGMLEVAAEKAARRGIVNFETRQCDVGAMPFDDGSFDAVTCRFGFMFFPDIGLGLKEMKRVSKPGARICSAVWGAPERNPWATTVMSAIAAHVEMPPAAPGAPGLFRCAAPGFMASAYQDAGLRNIVETEISGEVEFDSPGQYWLFMTEIAAPVVAGLAKTDEPTRDAIRDAVLSGARQTSGNGKARFNWSARVITGER